MTIDNIALVRATNIIPFDGVLKPISNVGYLTKNISLEFSNRLSDLLNELGIIPEKEYGKNYEEMVKLAAQKLSEYLPYISDYNSFVLFSLNGIVPDDIEHGFANNTFSNKNCAVIEPLKYHINETVSLIPTDTAVKGDVYLSNEAIVLIREEVLSNLKEEDKSRLQNMNIVSFTGSLKEALKSELIKSGKYTAEDLNLSQASGGYTQSSTSEELKKTINDIILEYGLSNQKYFNLLTTTDTSMPKYSEVCDEYDNILKVFDYFLIRFFDELLVVLNASDNLKNSIRRNPHSRQYVEEVISLIKQYGIENYKMFVDNYNKKLEEERLNGTLITPSEVIRELTSTISK